MSLSFRTDLSSDVLRGAFAMFPSGVTAVCAQGEDAPVGMAASSFTSVSIEPPLVSVCVAHASTTWPTLRAAPRVGISVLGADHGEIARELSARTGDRFAHVRWESAEDGSVYVHGSSLWLDCEIDTEIAAGDHDIVVLRVHAVRPWPDVSPMVFHGSEFRHLLPPAVDRHAGARDADELEILAQEERRCRAVSELDLGTLAELLADDLTHTHVNGVTQTKSEYLAGLGSRPRTVSRSQLTVQVLGDVALMRGRLANRFPGMPADAVPRQLQVLQVWVRRGVWQQVAFACAGPLVDTDTDADTDTDTDADGSTAR